MSLDLLQVLPAALRDVRTETAAADGAALARSSDLKDCLPLAMAHQPSADERMARAIHEATHGVVASVYESPSIELVLRADCTGYCRIEPLAKLEHQILFALAGYVGEVRYRPRSIHNIDASSYDLIAARLALDAWQDAKRWPPMTYTAATRAAIKFVDKNWRAIKNVATALDDCGSMDTYAVNLFARCEP